MNREIRLINLYLKIKRLLKQEEKTVISFDTLSSVERVDIMIRNKELFKEIRMDCYTVKNKEYKFYEESYNVMIEKLEEILKTLKEGKSIWELPFVEEDEYEKENQRSN
jgi:hypothetical protein